MNTVLIIKEFKRELKGFLIATSMVVGYLSLTMVIYSSMEFSLNDITDLWGGLPEGFMKALNFDGDQWRSVLGFYATYFVFYIPLISGGFSVVWGLRQLSKEEHLKTAEFLLTRPISRDQIISSKLLVLFTYIVAVNLLAYIAGLISCTLASANAFNIASLTILHVYGVFACLFFGSLGMFISTLVKRGKSSVGIGVGIIAAAYLFDMIIKIYGKADFLLYLTPFKYIDLQLTRPDYHLEGWRILIPLAVSIILIAGTYIFYRRKDILV